MKVIIAGGRTITDYELLKRAVAESKYEITEVISGGASGADALGEQYAQENGIKLTVFPAQWNIHGRAAGPIRNREMAEYGEALIALWDGDSRGTKDMINQAKKNDLEVYVKKYKQCIECGTTATHVRCTQFAGDHPYCEAHAKAEDDFLKGDSYTYWTTC